MLALTFFYVPLSVPSQPGSIFDYAQGLFGPLHHWHFTR
jgi:hypothetical protein